LITARVEATEEAIINALTMAITVVGRGGHRIEAISLTRLRTILDHRAKLLRRISTPVGQTIPSLAFPSLASLSSRDSLASGGFA
jgi:hypothetical protein